MPKADARHRVLFLTDNGHGLGHVTRLLAMARRCPADVQPVFVTMSASHHLIASAGFPVEYFPSAARWGVHAEDWSALLGRKLLQAVSRLQPDVLVVDHVRPSMALRDVRARFPALGLVWVRRGLWRRGRNADALDLAPVFDRIVEPLDLAAAVDAGLTAVDLERVVHVPPVTLLDADEVEPRAEARAELGLEQDRPVVLVHLSADGAEELSRSIRRAADVLAGAWPEAQLVAPDHALHRGRLDVGARVALREVYPLARYLGAFDLGVTTAGYNSYHEVVVAGLPSIFVPRLTSTMDDQQRRAEHAQLGGYGWYVGSLDGRAFERAVRDAREPLARRRVVAAMRAAYPGNGAYAAADLLADLARRSAAPAGVGRSDLPPPAAPSRASSGRVVVDASHLDDRGVDEVVTRLRAGGTAAPVLLVGAEGAATAQRLGVLHETLLPADVVAWLEPALGYDDYVDSRLRELVATCLPSRIVTDVDEVG